LRDFPGNASPWLAEASGHGDFLEYHVQSNHPPEATKECLCGRVLSRDHFSSCPLPSTTRSRGGWTRKPSGPPSNCSDLGPTRSSPKAKPSMLPRSNPYWRCDPPDPSSVL